MRTRALLAVLLAVVLVCLAGCGGSGSKQAGTAVDSSFLTVTPSPYAPTWLSGASGDGVADGTFGTWRGAPVEIAGTWNDSEDAQTAQYTVMPGMEYGAWTGDLDVAVGAIYEDQGETWAQAATGAYDDRWRTALTTLAAARASQPGTTYIRFAHEFNGDFAHWAVKGSEVDAFKTAWDRFRALQQQIFPAAKLVFCPTSDTSDSLGLDWRQAFPGSSEVDVVAVDYYNQYPYLGSASSFAKELGATDEHGAPRGLEAYREFAQAQGLPFAIPEWSSNADDGDGAAFLDAFYHWVAYHAGTGAGQVLYEIQFNVSGFGDGQFQLYPDSHMPDAAETYKSLW